MIRQFEEEIMDTEIGYRLEEVLEILFEYDKHKEEYKDYDSEIRTTFEVMDSYTNDQIHINIKTYNKKGVLVICENLFRYYDYYKTAEDFKTLIAILDYITDYKAEEEDDTSFKSLKPDMEFENLYGRIDYIISELDSTLEIESFNKQEELIMKKVFDKETMDTKFEHAFWEEDEVITEFETRIKEEFGKEKVKIKYFVCIPCIESPHRIYVGMDAINTANNEELFTEEIYQFDKNLMKYLDEFLIILDYISKSKSAETEHIKFRNLGTETDFNSLVFKIKTIFEYLDLEDVDFSFS